MVCSQLAPCTREHSSRSKDSWAYALDITRTDNGVPKEI
jgi:hypothetical protein